MLTSLPETGDSGSHPSSLAGVQAGEASEAALGAVGMGAVWVGLPHSRALPGCRWWLVAVERHGRKRRQVCSCALLIPKEEMGQELVAHTCNPSFSGGTDWEDHCSKPAWANSS
jgi:hypothetical protein